MGSVPPLITAMRVMPALGDNDGDHYIGEIVGGGGCGGVGGVMWVWGVCVGMGVLAHC